MHDAFRVAQAGDKTPTLSEPLIQHETIHAPAITVNGAPEITTARMPATPMTEYPQIRVEEVDDQTFSNGQPGVDGTRGDIGKEVNWRHGDLKPENILIFGDTWQIADLGLAKKHDRKTDFRRGATNQIFATLDYEAPEALTHPDLPTSRRYDIWSMGCLFFETFIWLLEGQKGLDKFLGDNSSARGFQSTSHYYEVTNVNENALGVVASAKVSSKVRDWIIKLRKEDPELNTGSPTALSDLLDLIENKLLVVSLDGSEDESRATAEVLCSKLADILAKGAKLGGDTYLFSGREQRVSECSTPQNYSPSHLGSQLLSPTSNPQTQVCRQ